MKPMLSVVHSFTDLTQGEVDIHGGKGASLITMTGAGMPVPPGFVITTGAFDEFRDASGLSDLIDSELDALDVNDVKAVDAASARIRGALEKAAIPDSVRSQVRDAYQALMDRIGRETPVAVRSSATAEDLPDASFAGQQDTYLWINGAESVKEHVRRCWASLYTSRAITYRRANNIDEVGLSMAVVVQKMVNARTAGVAMTLDPATGDRSKVVIDASYGLGELVVSGTVTPDNTVLDKITFAVVRQHLGDKARELVPVDGSLVERHVDNARRSVPCLSTVELRAVAELAKRAEKHYRVPQDIEWAIDADLPDGENLLLLQARPETVHGAKPLTATVPQVAATSGFSLGSITASLTRVSA
ncbi:phosphoenolpyruvate synthase [Microbacterium sp. CH12i]|uniref:PEP/pyruvate-binding domain-containing protein n=1 Tax=Microbacterium sp. CH12i TaxID=1479651 RepID=UPI000460B319|nr:PEP/pyruvate-binding domain-containing protein [Microbacterium sp. CH12i]KDA06492.1 phosphoenolpyruvate synthase [Microbacterium sp. CH12i]